MIWMTSMWTQLYGVYLHLSHFKLQFILGKIVHKTCDLSRINLEVWDAIISDNWKVDQRSGWDHRFVHDWLEPSYVEKKHLYFVIELFKLSKSKTYVFVDSVLCLGGIGTAPVQAWKQNWMEFGDTQSQRFGSNRRGADGIRVEKLFSQDSLRWEFSTRFKRWCGIKVWTWAISRKDHLHVDVQWHWLEKNKETEKNVFWALTELLSMLENSREDMGHFRTWIGEEMVRNSCQQTWWTMGQNCWNHDAQLCQEWTSKIPCYQCIRKKRIETKKKGMKSIHFNGSEETVDLRTINYFCQSAQYIRNCRRFMQRIKSRFKKSNRRWDLWIFGDTDWDSNANAISQSSTSLAQGDFLQEYERKIAELPDDQKLSKPCSDAGFLRKLGKDISSFQLKKDLRLCSQHVENTHNLEISNLLTARVDSFEYKDRPGLGCEGLLSSRTLLHWYHDWILV